MLNYQRVHKWYKWGAKELLRVSQPHGRGCRACRGIWYDNGKVTTKYVMGIRGFEKSNWDIWGWVNPHDTFGDEEWMPRTVSRRGFKVLEVTIPGQFEERNFAESPTTVGIWWAFDKHWWLWLGFWTVTNGGGCWTPTDMGVMGASAFKSLDTNGSDSAKTCTWWVGHLWSVKKTFEQWPCFKLDKLVNSCQFHPLAALYKPCRTVNRDSWIFLEMDATSRWNLLCRPEPAQCAVTLEGQLQVVHALQALGVRAIHMGPKAKRTWLTFHAVDGVQFGGWPALLSFFSRGDI